MRAWARITRRPSLAVYSQNPQKLPVCQQHPPSNKRRARADLVSVLHAVFCCGPEQRVACEFACLSVAVGVVNYNARLKLNSIFVVCLSNTN